MTSRMTPIRRGNMDRYNDHGAEETPSLMATTPIVALLVLGVKQFSVNSHRNPGETRRQLALSRQVCYKHRRTKGFTCRRLARCRERLPCQQRRAAACPMILTLATF